MADLSSYPFRLHAKEMAVIFGFSLKRFYALELEGTFIQFEERPRIGNRKAWLRSLVERHLNGEPIESVARRRKVHAPESMHSLGASHLHKVETREAL